MNQSTISKWCTNTTQPSIEILLKIAELLEVEYTQLIRAEAISGKTAKSN